MTGHFSLGPGAEFDAVRALLERWGTSAIGIGDDAAILDVPAGSRLVVSTDSTVEEVHFRRAWLSPREIGWRATTAALSDLAAMGAAPLGVLLGLTIPTAWRADLDALAHGIGDAVERHGASIVGGDVTDGDRLTLAITVLGHTPRPLSRAGACEGDTIFVTGQLGGSGAALDALIRGVTPAAAVRERFAHPEARIAAGIWLGSRGATAAIDISDGFSGDIAHLAAASGVRCVIQLDAIPRCDGVDVTGALSSGEEYELIVTVPTGDPEAFSDEFRRANDGLRLTAVGQVEASESNGAGEVLAVERGVRVAMPGAFDHFASGSQ